MGIFLRGLVLNNVYRYEGEDGVLEAFEVSEFDIQEMDRLTVRYYSVERMKELYKDKNIQTFGWYFEDDDLHYRCPVTSVSDKSVVQAVIGNECDYVIYNSAISKIQDFIRYGYYYVSPNYDKAVNKERYIVNFSLCSVSASTLHVYISFRGDEGWRTETIYELDGYDKEPYLGDFYVGSVSMLDDPCLVPFDEVEFGGSIMYIYKLLKVDLNCSPRYTPSPMPVPIGLINTLAYHVECDRYLLSTLRDFAKSLRLELGIDDEVVLSDTRHPSTKSTIGKVLKITTNIGTPNKEYKKLMLNEAVAVTKLVLDTAKEINNKYPIGIFDSSQSIICDNLFSKDYLYHEVQCILNLARCLILTEGEKTLMLYSYVLDEISIFKLEDQIASLYLLQFRINAYKGWMDKGVNNRMYYIGGAYPYDSTIVTK